MRRLASRDSIWRVTNPFWNRDERRLRALWRLLLQAAIFVGLGFGMRMLGQAVLGDAPPPPVIRRGLAVLISAAGLALGARLLERRRLRSVGLSWDRESGLDLGFGLLLGAVLMSGIFVVEWALGWLVVTDTFQPAPGVASFDEGILRSVMLFVAVGIQEELVSRGWLLRGLGECLGLGRLSPARALALGLMASSVLFGLGHAGNPNATPVSTFNIVLAGLLLGFGYVVTGRLALPIGLHITWNFFQGSVFGLPVSGQKVEASTFLATRQAGPELWTGGDFGPEAGLIGLIAMAAGTLATFGWAHFRQGEARMCAALLEPPTAPAAAQPPETPAAA